MSPDVFLSQHQIRTDGEGGKLGSSPAEIVSNLQSLNELRSWDDNTQSLEENVYETQGFVPAPFGPSDFDPDLVDKEFHEIAVYYESLKSGDLNRVHQAIDDVNTVRAEKGDGEFHPSMSDFSIVAHGKSSLAVAARLIISERQSVSETGAGSFSGSPIPWFDTKDAFDALNSYIAS